MLLRWLRLDQGFTDEIDFTQMNSALARALVIGIAGLGANGEALLLFHSLADCYPYKMMSTPSGLFYEIIAYIGLIVAPAVSVGVTLWLSRSALWLVPPVACALSPAAFLAIFAMAHAVTGVDMSSTHNFDYNTPAALLDKFASEVFWLGVLGSCIGAMCGAVISFGRLRSKRAAAQEA